MESYYILGEIEVVLLRLPNLSIALLPGLELLQGLEGNLAPARPFEDVGPTFRTIEYPIHFAHSKELGLFTRCPMNGGSFVPSQIPGLGDEPGLQ